VDSVISPAGTTASVAGTIRREVARRRTFAIISHPDAGKTTLTEKLLLYSGAVEQAGAVRARKNQRSATSDWMAMERERGISITSTVLQFEYRDCIFNLLDTPGHQDFSEDTYRTLMAADSAVMVLDSAKGIEAQTLKLFEVCRQRRLPILTFINKLDHEGREPLELLDEIERVLHLQVSPMNWPIGAGYHFQGVYDVAQQAVLLFERTTRGRFRAPVRVTGLDDPLLAETVGERAYAQLREDVELLSGAGVPFEREAFLRGELTPVFFGSAINNFGVEPFLDALADLAPSPRARESSEGPVEPTHPAFSGFIFKIQANMDPLHRDRMAFLRVCSGRFEKDMTVHHPRLGRAIRMTRPHRLFAQDRETVEEAFPGDVIGLSNPGMFTIGDTVCAGGTFEFPRIPPFMPECFALLRNQSVAKHKHFNNGLQQLQEEGVVQVLYSHDLARREPILAAVGELQFDVVVARLAAEYGAEATLERLPYVTARWVDEEDEGQALALEKVTSWLQTRRAHDAQGRLVILFSSPWELSYFMENNRQLVLRDASGNVVA
jgi:peptide chain release factor 3